MLEFQRCFFAAACHAYAPDLPRRRARHARAAICVTRVAERAARCRLRMPGAPLLRPLLR